MSTEGETINEECVGPSSEQAGKANSCAGCPNQKACASGEAKQVDPATAHITDRCNLIKHKLLVLSGKGGVGKSTVSAQLAFTLSQQGYQVGLLDIDICGPSVPRMLGLNGHEVHQSSCGWSPVYVNDNLGVMSIGFMLPNQDDAVIWRGPRKNGLIKQFLSDVDWGNLDYLIIDTPPGTSDEHISVVQHLMAACPGGEGLGAVVVTTPQEVAMADVRKELNFCKKTGLKVFGIIENMSEMVLPLNDSRVKFIDTRSGIDVTQQLLLRLSQVCPEFADMSLSFPLFTAAAEPAAATSSSSSATATDIELRPPMSATITTTGPQRMAVSFHTDYLGALPMDPALLTCGETGVGLSEHYPHSLASRCLNKIVEKLIVHCTQQLTEQQQQRNKNGNDNIEVDDDSSVVVMSVAM